ncbi:WG repeat-containing protein [Dysgonomonas massiliensis]|uniref:WG repeat-containing protein n=1 Tax=Dysgonomonas massiliensis TaxID=2040292 RepID=UPI000C766C73|nr:WG repeat-containing protein [Dysgonomonas massiliensis]
MRHSVFITIIALLLLTGCNSSRLPITDFSASYPLTDLNGRYWSGVTGSSRGNLAYAFNKHNFEPWLYKVEAVDLYFNGKDSLYVEFYDPENELLKSRAFRGEKKGPYFEIYFKKRLVPIPAAFFRKSDRIRIGIDDEKKLVIHNWYDSFTWLIVIIGGFNEDYSDSTPKQSDWIYSYQGVRNFKVGDRWGCINSRGDTIIAPEYDMLFPFDVNNNIYVKKGHKWALADTTGRFLTPFVFSKIYAPDTDNQAVYRVTQKITNEDWKFGYIDKYGRQWLDCVYDEIVDLNAACKMIRQGNLYGMATYEEGIIIPVKFRKGAISKYLETEVMTVDKKVFPRRVVQVKYRGKYYYIDDQGNMYPQVRKFLAFPRIDTSTRLDVHQIEPDID